MEQSPDQSSFSRSERQEFIHRLIEEFREYLSSHQFAVNPETDGIMALSGPPVKDEFGEYIITPENTARIEYAIDAVREVTAKRLHKDVEQVTSEDITANGPTLYLNGEAEQLPSMQEIALNYDMPTEKMGLVDCGRVGSANTSDQFKVMKDNPAYDKLKHLTVVSSGYHAPRVARAAVANSPADRDFDVIGVPVDHFQIDVYRKVRGEVKRILNYSAAGYMAKENPLEKKDAQSGHK